MTPDPHLKDVIQEIWSVKLEIALGGVLGLIAAGLLIFTAVPRYKAVMIVGPADSSLSSDVSGNLSPSFEKTLYQLWAYTQSVETTSDFTRFEQIVDGPSVAEKLVEEKDLLKNLMQDPKAENLDSLEKLSLYLSKAVHLENIGMTSFRRVSYCHPNPDFAKRLLQELHRLADSIIREDRKNTVNDRISYLQKAMAQTNNPEHRKVLADMLMQQERIRMLVSVDAPFSSVVIEKPYTGPKPHWPNPRLIFPGFLAAGLLLGAFLGFLRQSFKNHDQ